MGEWAKASYKGEEIDSRRMITTLKYIKTVGKYNIYEVITGQYIVIFSDQVALLNLVNDHIGSLFAIQLLNHDNNKYHYDVEMGDKRVKVFTLAQAEILLYGSKENPIDLIIGNKIVLVK